MADLTVKKLSDVVGTPVKKLLVQMKEAGLGHSSEIDVVTEKDRKVLLDFIRKQSKTTKTISLKTKKEQEVPSSGVVKIRRKNVLKKTSAIEKNTSSDFSIPNFE